MATIVIETTQDQQVPFTYALTGAQTFTPETAFATFDGSGASGPFLACMSFLAPDGKRFMRVFPTTPVAGGDVADVTFAPFPGGIASSSGGGAGIQFDQDNVGTWLNIQTTGSDPANPLVGVNIQASLKVLVDSDDTDFQGGILQSEVQSVQLAAGADWNGNGQQVFLGQGPNLSNPCASIEINAAALGFFGVLPVAQPATPVTLGDVIALLQNYGLSA